jgi:hypothetical protein
VDTGPGPLVYSGMERSAKSAKRIGTSTQPAPARFARSTIGLFVYQPIAVSPHPTPKTKTQVPRSPRPLWLVGSPWN